MNECVIKGPQDRINWLIVSAFRYCVVRHRTQAMYGVGDVILDNLDVLHTEFIKQFIREIEREQYVTELDQGRNKRYETDFFARLKTHVKDYQRCLKYEKGEKQQELYTLLCKVMELIPQVDMSHKWPAWECWRLQGFPDEYFDRAVAAGVSDSQLYKQAGNAVTVNVAEAIGKRLKEIVDNAAD